MTPKVGLVQVLVKLTPDNEGEPPSSFSIVGADQNFEYGTWWPHPDTRPKAAAASRAGLDARRELTNTARFGAPAPIATCRVASLVHQTHQLSVDRAQLCASSRSIVSRPLGGEQRLLPRRAASHFDCAAQ